MYCEQILQKNPGKGQTPTPPPLYYGNAGILGTFGAPTPPLTCTLLRQKLQFFLLKCLIHSMYYIPEVKQDLEQSGENIPTRPSSEHHAWLHVFSNNEITPFKKSQLWLRPGIKGFSQHSNSNSTWEGGNLVLLIQCIKIPTLQSNFTFEV